MKYIRGLYTVLSKSFQMKYIEGPQYSIGVCPNENIGGLSTVLSKSVQMKYIGGLSTVFSESVQMKKKIYRRVVQHFIGVCPTNLREN